MGVANQNPIFPIAPNISFGKLQTANTAKDGTGTTVTVFTAGANGGRIDTIKVRALGTNVATSLRIFINNGSDPTTAANNVLYLEATIAATTLSEADALVDTELALDLGLPPGYKILVTIGTTVAAGLMVTGVGGDY